MAVRVREPAAARARTVRRRSTRGIAAPLVLVLALALGSACAASAFDLQGHRGARGLAPENTLAGIDAALAVGVDTLELDVVASRDDVLVVAHDRALNPDLARDASGRWLDGRGPLVRRLDFAALRTYDVGRLRPGSAYASAHPAQRAVDGERMPSLAEVFSHVRRHAGDRVRFNVETKLSPLAPDEAPDPETFARLVVDAIGAAGVAARTTVQSFDWRTLRAVQRLEPAIGTVFLSAQRPTFDTIRAGDPGGSPWTAGVRHADHGSVPRMVRAAGGGTWSPNAADLDAAAVAEARALGLKVVPWTVNDPAAMRRLIDWGVDGLITDRPDLLRALLVELGLRPALR